MGAERRSVSEAEPARSASFVQAARRPSRQPDPGARASGLPPALSSFVGRARERALLDALVEGGARLVTLLGPAGAGKTRLAVEWARGRRAELVDRPVYFCDLTEARSLDGVCYALAAALGVPIARGSTAEGAPEQLGAALASCGAALVVLDNFEQVVAWAGATVGEWLAQAPEATLLATSRSPLGLPGESLCEVGPLALPAPGVDARLADAVELFVDRARAARPGFQPTASEAAAIADVVARLDGMPLAIELAAARMRVLSPRQIALHLARRFELCARSAPGAPARHATLRAAIDWSWDLLEPAERAALVQCAVFRGGFDLEAAEAVLSLDGAWALDAVQALCERSLAQACESPTADGTMRYRLYESVREYAAERLAQATERAEVEARHEAHYHALALDAERAAGARGRSRTLALLATEFDNLLAVHRRATTHAAQGDVGAATRALELAVALEPLALARGPLGLGLETLEQALAVAGPLRARAPALVARALLARAHILAELDRPDESLASREEAHALAVRSGDGRLEGRVQASLARAAWHAGDLERAAELCEGALLLHRAAGDRVMEGRTMSYRASAEHARGWLDEARRDYDRALATLRAVGDRQGEGVTLGHLARLEHDAGATERARVRYAQAIDILRAIGDRYNEAGFVAELGHVALELGDAPLAHGLYERALAAQREVGNHRAQALGLLWLGRAAELEGACELAREHYAAAAERLGDAPHPLTAGLLACFAGRLAADAGEIERAEAYLVEAERELARAGRSLLAPLTSLCRGHLDLARARQAPTSSDAATHVERALDALRLARGATCAEVRLSARALEAAIAAARPGAARLAMLPPPEQPDHPEAPDSAPDTDREGLARDERPSWPLVAPFAADALLGVTHLRDERPSSPIPAPRPSLPPSTLWVSDSGRAFRPPTGELVDLATRGPLRRILSALADQRESAPGEALGRDALVAAGWPGERLVPDAAAGRVYAAVATLRRMGLREWLVRRDDGYLLDAAVPFRRGGADGVDSSRVPRSAG